MTAAGGPTPLSVRGVSRSFGARTAVREVTFDVQRGERMAIIGPNGAGKTTLLSMLAGVLQPTAGKIARGDQRPFGWVPQQLALYMKLSVAENLRLFARLEGLRDPDAAVARMLVHTGLEARASEPVGRLSGGNAQRVNIAIGLLADPAVLLLDEPSAALDPRQRELLWQLIGALAESGTSVIYSTHAVTEAERHADRVLVLSEGEQLFIGSPRELELAAGPAVGAVGDLEAAFVALLVGSGR